MPAAIPLLLSWAHRTLSYARKVIVEESLIFVYCQAGEKVGRAPRWTLLATLMLMKTNSREEKHFF